AHLRRLGARIEPLPAPHLEWAERRRQESVRPVDLARHEIVRSRPVARRRTTLVYVAHELRPRRRDDAAAAGVVHDPPLIVVADPDAGHDFRREPDEPRVGVVVRGAGLPGHGDAQSAHGTGGRAAAVQPGARLAPHHVTHHVEHEPVVLGIEHLFTLHRRLVEDVALLILDALNADRVDPRAVVRERGVRRYQLYRLYPIGADVHGGIRR